MRKERTKENVQFNKLKRETKKVKCGLNSLCSNGNFLPIIFHPLSSDAVLHGDQEGKDSLYNVLGHTFSFPQVKLLPSRGFHGPFYSRINMLLRLFT